MIPSLSNPAWASFMTRRKPSNHSIFYFVKKRANSCGTYYVNSTNVRGSTPWDILGEYGWKVGILR